jgi:5-formyltetrahydrofolate cyclo-ligase
MNDVTSAKAALRKEALARRDASITPEQSVAFGERLAEIGARFAAERQVRTASAFASIGSEPPTAPLLAALAKLGIGTGLPVMQGRGKPLLFRLWAEGEPLNEVKWGIKEPLPAAPEVFPDLLFVPLAAYDRSGNRLGYGAGFYDRTLARLRAMKPITTVGVAFSIQETETVPTDATDEKLDFVLTDRDWIICK